MTPAWTPEGEIAYLRNRVVQLKRIIAIVKNDKVPLVKALQRIYAAEKANDTRRI